MTAIAATFADFRPVKSRGVYQIILEVPAERANDALIALGGLPLFGSEQWVGVAPLVGKPQAEQQPSPPPSPEKAKERRPFHTLPRSQQAALLCNDNRFWWWLSDKEDRRIGPPPPGHPPYVETEQEAADAVRSMCGVASRRDLDQPDHALKWDRMVEEFSAASGRATWERPA